MTKPKEFALQEIGFLAVAHYELRKEIEPLKKTRRRCSEPKKCIDPLKETRRFSEPKETETCAEQIEDGKLKYSGACENCQNYLTVMGRLKPLFSQCRGVKRKMNSLILEILKNHNE